MGSLDEILAANRKWSDACAMVAAQERKLTAAKARRAAVAREVHGLIPVDIMADKAGVTRSTIWNWTKEDK